MTETKVQIAVPNTAIGIDLGTTFCRVALWQNGKVTVIANKLGNKMTPSCVAFSDTGRFLGEAAKNQRFANHKYTIQVIKRLLGVDFSDEKIQQVLKLESFEVKEHGKQLKCHVKFKDTVKKFAPEELIAMLLMEMKETAEAHLGGNVKVKDVVITVPSYFNQFQRQATLNAGTIAGLNVLRLINDPTAAALAYELSKNFIDVETKKNVMFFCFGGGSLSVSVVEITDGSGFQVLSTAGDTHLGGEDFDNKLAKYCIEKLSQKHKKDLSLNSKSILRLKVACEKAKRMLSSDTYTSIVVDGIYEEIDFAIEITRARFENICEDLLRSAMEPVEQALKAAKLKTSEISDVVLIGGSTKIPKIQKLLQDYFNGKDLIMSANMEDSVVYGAAVQAAILSTTTNAAVPKVEVVDVTPFSFFYPVAGGITRNINKSNCKIPFVFSREMFTMVDKQTTIGLEISEASTGSKIGSVRFDVPSAPAGVSKVLCDFKIDANGILHALRKLDGGTTEEALCINSGSLTSAEVLEMAANAVNFKQEYDLQRELASLLNLVENHITNVRQSFEDVSKKATERYNQIISLIDNHEFTSEGQVRSTLVEAKKELTALVMKSAEILRLPNPFDSPEDQPDSTRVDEEPAAKKVRPT